MCRVPVSTFAKLFILHSWWQSKHNPMRLLPQFQHFQCNPFPPSPPPPPASSDHTSTLVLHTVQTAHITTRWPLLLSKIRKLPHWGRVLFAPLVTQCPPVWRWWRWWENILYSSQPVWLLYLYISMWSPLWEHHICSAQQYQASPLSVFVCFIHLQSAELMSLNLTSGMSTFSVTFSAVLSRPWYGYQTWLLSVQAVNVTGNVTYCRQRVVWGDVRWCDTQCGGWCYMTSPHSSHAPGRQDQTRGQARPGVSNTQT